MIKMINLNLSVKSEMFVCDLDSIVDFLEGTIRSSKTVSGIFKFMLKVADSKQSQFVLAAEESTTAVKNCVVNDYGILNIFDGYTELKTTSADGKHILFNSPNGIKKIYIVGFYDIRKWKKILGSTLGGAFIDEVNLVNMQFFKELLARMVSVEDWFLICTCNGDDPNIAIYREHLNQCRPHKDYNIPQTIRNELEKSEPKKGWRYWHFDFKDNPAMTDDKIVLAENLYPKDSIYYKIKILGLRARAEGLIYTDIEKHFINDIDKFIFDDFTIGVDVGGSHSTSYTLTGFTIGYKYVVILSSIKVIDTISSPNDSKKLLSEFIMWINKWITKYPKIRNAFVDSAAKIFRLDLSRVFPRLDYYPSYKKDGIYDRIELTNTLFSQGRLFINEKECKPLTDEFRQAVWEIDKTTGVTKIDNKNKPIRLKNEVFLCDSLDGFEYSLVPNKYKLLKLR